MREVSRHKINGRFAPKKCTNYVTDEKWYCKIWNRFLVIKNYLSILAENGEIFLAEIAVAPFVGAWIETDIIITYVMFYVSRSLRGSVD